MTRTTPSEDSHSAGNPPPAPASRREEITPTVKSRGNGDAPTKKQRAVFAEVLSAKEFTAAERGQRLDWAATHATKKTMSEMIDWLKCERWRRERATHEEAA